MKRTRTIGSLLFIALATGLVILAAHTRATAHCQIPCGIYGDETRFALLGEHITTIEKSMNLIGVLSEDPARNANQLVRWVQNKEAHADEIAEIVTEYFLRQRIKPADATDTGYVTKLTLCHQLLVASMKAKQTTDKTHVEALRNILAAFQKAYGK